jgi:hypothetical protein
MNATHQRRWRWAIGLALVVVASSLASFVFITSFTSWNPFVRIHTASPRNVCIANLIMINGATMTWALENKKATNARPTHVDIFGSRNYIRETLACPSGGTYTIGSMGRKPRCSIRGHTI